MSLKRKRDFKGTGKVKTSNRNNCTSYHLKNDSSVTLLNITNNNSSFSSGYSTNTTILSEYSSDNMILSEYSTIISNRAPNTVLATLIDLTVRRNKKDQEEEEERKMKSCESKTNAAE